MNMNSQPQSSPFPEHVVAEEMNCAVKSIEEIPETNGGAYLYKLEDGRECIVQFSDYERYRSRGIRLDVADDNYNLPKLTGAAYFFFQKTSGRLIGCIFSATAQRLLEAAPVRFEKNSRAPYKSIPLGEGHLCL